MDDATDNATALATDFAPAKRTPIDDLERQIGYFRASPLLRQLLDALPILILIVNRERLVVHANRALFQLLERIPEEVALGQRPGELLGCIHAREHHGGCGTSRFCRECGAVKAVLSAIRGQGAIEEVRIMTDPGAGVQSCDMRVWTTPLEFAGESFTIVALQDISDEKRRRALEHVFFHDVRNTLSGLQSAVELMTLDVETDKLKTLATGAHKASTRLAREIIAQQELLEAESGELLLSPEWFYPVDLLQGLVETYTSHPTTEGRILQLDGETPPAEMLSDITLLERILGNMIKNALEACEPGQTVTLGCRAVETEVEFWVHNPTVMPESVQLQIFQRSFSTKGKGRGLGTYSIKLLSERYLQGRVGFHSSSEEGTRFFGRYPLQLKG